MTAGLVASLVEIIQRRTGKLQLAAWLECYRAAVGTDDSDDVALLHDRLGIRAKLCQKPFKKRADSSLAIIGDRRQIVPVKQEFLMLGADFLFADRCQF
jgi:hypothetical protein